MNEFNETIDFLLNLTTKIYDIDNNIDNETISISTTIETIEIDYSAIPCREDYDPNSSADQYEFWFGGIILIFIGIIGILGNILSMVILSRPQMRSSINYLLIGLARCDTILILTSLLLFGFRSIYPYTGYLFFYHYYIYPNIVPYIFPLATSAQTASIYLTFIISLERFVAVCHPLRARALCTYGRAKVYVFICILFACTYNIIRFWEIEIRADSLPEHGLVYCVRSTELRRNSTYITVYIHWCYLVINYIIPFTGLLIFNLLIYNQVRRANRERQRLSRSEKREIGLATMLLCVVIAFFLFNLLALYINICETFYDNINDDMIAISNLLVTLNSSVNFIIYVIFGEKFQRIFLLLFCKGRIGRESPDGLMHDDSSFSNGDNGGTGGGGGTGSSINRHSGRFSRHGTQRTTTSIRNGGHSTSMKIPRSTRGRAPSPGPIVYYPARDLPRTMSLNRSNGNTSVVSYDWDSTTKNNLITTSNF